MFYNTGFRSLALKLQEKFFFLNMFYNTGFPSELGEHQLEDADAGQAEDEDGRGDFFKVTVKMQNAKSFAKASLHEHQKTDPLFGKADTGIFRSVFCRTEQFLLFL
jgi:hypothetical protein